jgi:Mg-chelatase subunit ChlD
MKLIPNSNRKGAVLPFFALLLPIIFLLCGLAINTAHLQLLKTEMKISTDAAAHAGGRAMSIFQNTQDAIDWAEFVASQNQVGGQPLQIDVQQYVDFGFSNRSGNGIGRYSFSERNRAAVDSGAAQANSIQVIGHRNIPLVIRAIPNISSVDVSARAVATQVDRDIALVLDRSGSMLEYKDQDALEDEIRNDYYNYRIGYWEAVDAIRGPYRSFSRNVMNNLNGDMYEYAYDVRNRWWKGPRHSRWHQLDEAVDAFLDVLDDTDQEELVSVATFSSSARLDQALTLDYDPIRTMVGDTDPSGSTAIGQGIQEAVPSIMTAASARPFAAKTIVILTDGINNRNPNPVTVTQNLMQQYNITIHTVTFTSGADQTAMEDVADAGFGTHYHANTGNELIDIFEEIANNLPTILSE